MTSHELNSRLPYATVEELDFVRGHVANLSPTAQVVMIGAGPGVMLLAMREGNRMCPITVIDHDTTRYAEAHLTGAGLNRNVQYIVSDSSMAAISWRVPVDFLIVDGDHTYAGVKRDLVAWLPFVKPGGVVFLHDYEAEGTIFAGQERYPGVRQAVEEFFPEAELVRAGTAAIVRLPTA